MMTNRVYILFYLSVKKKEEIGANIGLD